MTPGKFVFRWWKVPTQDPEGVREAAATAVRLRNMADRLEHRVDVVNHLGEGLTAAITRK